MSIPQCPEDVRIRLVALGRMKIPKVPLQGQSFYAHCRVIDGDTVSICTLYGNEPYTVSLRIVGVDTPESTKSKAESELEMAAGMHVKHIVSYLVREVSYVKVIGSDKYCGRASGDVYLHTKECWLSQYLLNHRLAVPYAGKKKEKWSVEYLTAMLSATTIY